MNLKDAFHYQNYLDHLFDAVDVYLSNRNNLYNVTQEHLRAKANPGAVNETVNATAERPYDVDNMTVIRFMLAVLDEKDTLSRRIGFAKTMHPFDIDAAASANKYRRRAVSRLADVASLRPSEAVKNGSDFKLNATGEQVRYCYDVKEVRTIDFDRHQVKAIVKSLSAKADEISADIDRAVLDINVDFEPRFDPTDSTEDALERFAASIAASDDTTA